MRIESLLEGLDPALSIALMCTRMSSEHVQVSILVRSVNSDARTCEMSVCVRTEM